MKPHSTTIGGDLSFRLHLPVATRGAWSSTQKRVAVTANQGDGEGNGGRTVVRVKRLLARCTVGRLLALRRNSLVQSTRKEQSYYYAWDRDLGFGASRLCELQQNISIVPVVLRALAADRRRVENLCAAGNPIPPPIILREVVACAEASRLINVTSRRLQSWAPRRRIAMWQSLAKVVETRLDHQAYRRRGIRRLPRRRG